MNDQEFEQSLKLSYYKEIATLDEAHNIVMVQQIETARTYVKKTLSLYNKDVYTELMSHPIVGVPKIFEVIENGDTLIVIEEYISGITLEKLLEVRCTIPENDVRAYTVMLCDIISELHSLNPPIIHRDIKPSNVILTDSGKLVLVDLNGAKLVDSNQQKDTTLIGTIGYAAPEQYGFGASNIQTDIYAVGKLMTCLLTGSPDNIDSCPKEFKRIIKKCTNIDSSKRYASAIHLKEALLNGTNCVVKKLLPYAAIVCFIALIVGIIIFFPKSPDAPPVQSTTDNQVLNNHSGPLTEEPTTTNPLPTLESSPTLSSTPLPTVTSAPTPTVAIITNTSDVDYTVPAGVYEGNDKEKLVISENGFAYYYCSSVEFTEVECPWSIIDDKITITLSILHCDITANTKNGFEELVFKSKSLNWNNEVFTKISNDATSAILDPPPSPIKYVSLTHSGEKQFILDGIKFTIPKQFRAGTLDDIQYLQMGQNTLWETSVDDWVDGLLCFLDADAGESYFDESYISNIFFYPLLDIDVQEALTNPKSTAVSTSQNFLDKVQVNYTETIDVAGRSCSLVCVNGLLNTGFGGLSDYIMTGYIVLLPVKDNSRIVVIQMLQRAGMKQDDTEAFDNILKSAEIIVR